MKLRFYMRGLGIGMIVTALLVMIVSNSGNTSAQMSDEEIKAKAAELGMVEDRAVVLSDLIDTSKDNNTAAVEEESESPSSESASNEENTQNSESTQVSESAQNTESGASTKEQEEQESEASATKEPETQESETVATKEPETPESAEAATPESAADNTQSAESVSTAQSSQSENDEQQTVSESTTVSFKISSGSSSGMVSRNLVEAGLVDDAAVFDKYLCDNGYSKALRVGTYEIQAGASYEEIAKMITGKR